MLVVTAHPDDETLGAGATLAQLAMDDVHVHVLSLTAGEAAYGARASDRATLADRRRDEFAAATAALGVRGEVLDLPDGRIAAHAARAVREVRERAARLRAHHLLSIWEADPHPDHQAAGRAARDAAALEGLPHAGFPLWAFHWTDPGTVPLRGRLVPSAPGGQARDRRRRATECYPSQTRTPDGQAGPVVPPSVAAWSDECLVLRDA